MDKLFAFAENPRAAILVLTLLGAVMFLPGFFTVPPIDRDEARFAQASKQMIETNNFWDIHFQDDVRYKKPIGIYWLQVASTEIFGAPPYNQIWTYRVPSLLAAIASLWLTYLIGRALISSEVGFGAALLFASSLLIAAEARLAKTDAMLLAFTLLAMWQLAKFYLPRPLTPARQGRGNDIVQAKHTTPSPLAGEGTALPDEFVRQKAGGGGDYPKLVLIIFFSKPRASSRNHRACRPPF